MSSVLGKVGLADSAVYSATKAGQAGASRALAVELGQYNIRVNSISPGTIDTPMETQSGKVANVSRDAELKLSVLRRLGKPEEIGDAVVWLCSSESSYVTGINLFVDAGFSILKEL